jgi:hypothetical protein
MVIKCLPQPFTVYKAEDLSQVNLAGEILFLGKTDEEISVACPTPDVPERTLERDDGWRAFRIEGFLDFSLIGILSRISGLLAEAGISIFAQSTFNTDYIMTKAKNFARAISILEANGYEINKEDL